MADEAQVSEMIKKIMDLRDEVDALYHSTPATEDSTIERFQLKQCSESLDFAILRLRSFKDKERY